VLSNYNNRGKSLNIRGNEDKGSLIQYSWSKLLSCPKLHPIRSKYNIIFLIYREHVANIASGNKNYERCKYLSPVSSMYETELGQCIIGYCATIEPGKKRNLDIGFGNRAVAGEKEECMRFAYRLVKLKKLRMGSESGLSKEEIVE